MTATEYGDLDITINLSKRRIQRRLQQHVYTEAEWLSKMSALHSERSHAGRVNHPARQNHRIIPITINQSVWASSILHTYYNEHCIVFCGKHSPMKIDRSTFVKLFDFCLSSPHYFLGSNADLPIVGGSILTHDHFQGHHYEFAMAKAPIDTSNNPRLRGCTQAGIVSGLCQLSVFAITTESV